MAELCKELETLGRSNRVDGAVALLARLEHEFVQVREELTALVRDRTEAAEQT